MVKTLFSAALILYCIQTHGQRNQKTVEWLNFQKDEIFLPRSYANGIIHGNVLEINQEGILLSSEKGIEIKLNWKDIIEINNYDVGEIEIVSSQKFEEENLFINLSFEDAKLRKKFTKSLKKLSRQNKAKFISRSEPDYSY